MVSIQRSMRILNKGESRYTEEEAQAILDLLREIARIDYEDYKSKNNQERERVLEGNGKSKKRGEQ